MTVKLKINMTYPPFIKEYTLSIKISDYSLETNGDFSEWKKKHEAKLIEELSERISVKKTPTGASFLFCKKEYDNEIINE